MIFIYNSRFVEHDVWYNYRRRNVFHLTIIYFLHHYRGTWFCKCPNADITLPFVDRRQNEGDWQRIVRAASLISRKSYFPIRSTSGRISTVEKPVAFVNARASRDNLSFSCFFLAIDSYRYDILRNKPQEYFRLIPDNSSRLSCCLTKHIWQLAVHCQMMYADF